MVIGWRDLEINNNYLDYIYMELDLHGNDIPY